MTDINLFDYFQDAIILTNAEFNIEIWNKSAELIYGWNKAEVLNKNSINLLRSEFLDIGFDDVINHIKTKGRWEGIVKQNTKNNNHIFIYTLIQRIIDDNGEIIKYLAINRDINKQGFNLDELTRTNRQMVELARHLQTVREEERTKIAREIHDELGQTLTTLKMDLYSFIEKPENSVDATVNRLNRMISLIDDAIVTVRKITSELRIPLLDHLGLIAAIDWQIKEFQKRTNIKCTSNLVKEIEIDNERATAIFRIFQELLSNISKHSKATSVTIDIAIIENNITISVFDNGIGIQESDLHKSSSFGIIGIKERVKMLGGEFILNSTPQKGTKSLVLIPLKN